MVVITIEVLNNCGKYENKFIFSKYVDLFKKLDKEDFEIYFMVLS
jgi:hypothetical protein